MSSKCRESESCYNSGCRSEACRLAAAVGRRERRQREREAVGEFVQPVQPSLSIVGEDGKPQVREFLRHPVKTLGDVESAVALEIDALDAHPRPGLEAAALALAEVLDNPKATSTKPAAAAKLAQILDMLRKSTVARPRLAYVRALTSKDPTRGA